MTSLLMDHAFDVLRRELSNHWTTVQTTTLQASRIMMNRSLEWYACVVLMGVVVSLLRLNSKYMWVMILGIVAEFGLPSNAWTILGIRLITLAVVVWALMDLTRDLLYVVKTVVGWVAGRSYCCPRPSSAHLAQPAWIPNYSTTDPTMLKTAAQQQQQQQQQPLDAASAYQQQLILEEIRTLREMIMHHGQTMTMILQTLTIIQMSSLTTVAASRPLPASDDP